MEDIGEVGERGKKKSCTRRDLPGFWFFEIMGSGNMWNGPWRLLAVLW